MANAPAVTEASFERDVLKSELPVLVDFGAPWCAPCKAIAPVLDAIAKENSQLKIVAVDVDQEQNLAGRYGVMSLPTLILFHRGKPVTQMTGFRPKPELTRMLDSALSQLA